MNDENSRIKELLLFGSELAGSAVGSALGYMFLGPIAGAITSMAGVSISKLLGDITDRALSNREKTRIGAVAAFSINKIGLYINEGKRLRNDGFFDDQLEERKESQEVFEGVLLKAKNEHEEKKLKILGNIFANIAFSNDFSIGEANHLLQIMSSDLTYRKLCILALIQRRKCMDRIILRKTGYRENDNKIPHESISILQEIFELINLGLVSSKEDPKSDNYDAILSWNDITPNGLELTKIGIRYCDIMELKDIPDSELDEIANYLK